VKAAALVVRLREAAALPHLRAVRGSPADDAAFDRYAAGLTAHYGVLAAAFMILVTLSWWPVDYLIQPDPRYLETFAFLRARALFVFAAVLAAFLGSARARRAALWVAPALYAVVVALIGYALGRLGGPDLVWLADATLILVPPALIPLRPARRALALLLFGALLSAAFFLPFPENGRSPLARGQLSFVVFACSFAMVIGEVLLRVLRRAFFQQRSLDRARAELAELNASLSDRVGAQTAELLALAEHLDQAQEAERSRISRELHDELGQQLTALRYGLGVLEQRARAEPGAVAPLAAELSAMLRDTSATVRAFVSELRPPMLDDLGLSASAAWLCERVLRVGDADCRLEVSAEVAAVEGELDREISLLLFRALQEATTNAQKHAGAAVIEVSLDVVEGTIVAAVRDDGVGFDPAAATRGFGLLGLGERARRHGGRLRVDSAPGRGTRIAVAVPAAPRAPEGR
jgi:signal transduction histidine kinase